MSTCEVPNYAGAHYIQTSQHMLYKRPKNYKIRMHTVLSYNIQYRRIENKGESQNEIAGIDAPF